MNTGMNAIGEKNTPQAMTTTMTTVAELNPAADMARSQRVATAVVTIHDRMEMSQALTFIVKPFTGV
jgi:hypothetical protein